MRQIEHSCDACSEAASESFFGAVLPKSRNFLWVETLRRGQQVMMDSMIELEFYALVVVQGLLPPSITLYPYLDTPEDHFLPASEVNAQLYDIAIIDGEWS